jgi:hypothetical protein
MKCNNDTFCHTDVGPLWFYRFQSKLVDFGANGAFGGGDDKEHETITAPAKGSWVSLDIPWVILQVNDASCIAQLIYVEHHLVITLFMLIMYTFIINGYNLLIIKYL